MVMKDMEHDCALGVVELRAEKTGGRISGAQSACKPIPQSGPFNTSRTCRKCTSTRTSWISTWKE